MPWWAWILATFGGITLGIVIYWTYVLYQAAKQMAQM